MLVNIQSGLNFHTFRFLLEVEDFFQFFLQYQNLGYLLILQEEIGETELIMCNQMKPLPDKLQLDIMWAVATSSAIETRQKSHHIFAKLLYDELNDIQPIVSLGENWIAGKGSPKKYCKDTF